MHATINVTLTKGGRQRLMECSRRDFVSLEGCPRSSERSSAHTPGLPASDLHRGVHRSRRPHLLGGRRGDVNEARRARRFDAAAIGLILQPYCTSPRSGGQPKSLTPFRSASEHAKVTGVGLTPAVGHTRVSDVKVDEGSPKGAGSNTPLYTRLLSRGRSPRPFRPGQTRLPDRPGAWSLGRHS